MPRNYFTSGRSSSFINLSHFDQVTESYLLAFSWKIFVHSVYGSFVVKKIVYEDLEFEFLVLAWVSYVPDIR